MTTSSCNGVSCDNSYNIFSVGQGEVRFLKVTVTARRAFKRDVSLKRLNVIRNKVVFVRESGVSEFFLNRKVS